MLAGMETHSQDYSAVDSQEKAKALCREGKLEVLFLFPLEFGGKEIPQNTLYVADWHCRHQAADRRHDRRPG